MRCIYAQDEICKLIEWYQNPDPYGKFVWVILSVTYVKACITFILVQLEYVVFIKSVK